MLALELGEYYQPIHHSSIHHTQHTIHVPALNLCYGSSRDECVSEILQVVGHVRQISELLQK